MYMPYTTHPKMPRIRMDAVVLLGIRLEYKRGRPTLRFQPKHGGTLVETLVRLPQSENPPHQIFPSAPFATSAFPGVGWNDHPVSQGASQMRGSDPSPYAKGWHCREHFFGEADYRLRVLRGYPTVRWRARLEIKPPVKTRPVLDGRVCLLCFHPENRCPFAGLSADKLIRTAGWRN